MEKNDLTLDANVFSPTQPLAQIFSKSGSPHRFCHAEHGLGNGQISKGCGSGKHGYDSGGFPSSFQDWAVIGAAVTYIEATAAAHQKFC